MKKFDVSFLMLLLAVAISSLAFAQKNGKNNDVEDKTPKLDAKLISGLKWRNIGAAAGRGRWLCRASMLRALRAVSMA